jgi:hypothetical protein
MTVFWNLALCSLVEIDRRFRGASCIYHVGLTMEVVNISETPANF